MSSASFCFANRRKEFIDGGENVVPFGAEHPRGGRAADRWATRTQFADAVRALAPSGGALPPHLPSDHQTQWRQWLTAAGVDLERVRFQAAMNASEGGADNVMRFADSDGFGQGAGNPLRTNWSNTESGR